MKNKEKIILDLCGGTASWSDPYRRAGYVVYNITLPAYDVLKTTWDDTHIWFMPADGKYVLKVEKRKVYGIFAAPPCTQFSFARQRYKKPPDFPEAMKVVEACLGIVWECQKYGRLKFWAMENPTGHLRRFLGRPPFKFYQWQFGGFHVKPTDIWGWFESPKITHRKKPKVSRDARMKRWTNPKIPKKFQLTLATIGERRAAVRAITPIGFARSFYRANP